MNAFMDVQKNPNNLSKYEKNPKVKKVMEKLAAKFGSGDMWWEQLLTQHVCINGGNKYIFRNLLATFFWEWIAFDCPGWSIEFEKLIADTAVFDCTSEYINKMIGVTHFVSVRK